MCEKNTKNACSDCSTGQVTGKAVLPDQGSGTTGVSLFSNILLVLFPKCSFCVLAYSSSMLLCTRNETIVASSLHASPLTILITTVLSIFIAGGILLNWRGVKSGYAMTLVLSGLGMMLCSALLGGGEGLYYTGNALVFFGIWMNGNLPFQRLNIPL